MTSMFWGLKMESGKRYSTTVDKSFHVSMATLDPQSVNTDNEIVSVVLEEGNGGVFHLTNLRKKDHLFSNLDLNFATGDQITLFCKGQGVIHLSGYMVQEEDDDFSTTMLDEEAEEEEDEDDEEEIDDDIDESIMSSIQGKNEKKAAGTKRKQENEKSKKAKKKKTELIERSEDSDEDSEDDDDDDEGADLDDKDSDDEELEMEEEEDDKEEFEMPLTKKQKNQQKNQQQQQNQKQQNQKQQNQKQQNQKQQGKKKQSQTPNKTPNGTASPQQQQKGKKDEGRKSVDGKGQQNKQQGQNQEATLTGGVKVKDIRVGAGQLCKPGKEAMVTYCGRLKSNGKVFDSNLQGPGFKFKVGSGKVIKGWDIGIVGMKVGGKRIITCPPQVAYGQSGAPPSIPPNSTLVFEVELKNVN